MAEELQSVDSLKWGQRMDLLEGIDKLEALQRRKLELEREIAEQRRKLNDVRMFRPEVYPATRGKYEGQPMQGQFCYLQVIETWHRVDGRDVCNNTYYFEIKGVLLKENGQIGKRKASHRSNFFKRADLEALTK